MYNPAMHIVNRLAARGLDFKVDDCGRLLVRPRGLLTDDDRADIRNHRDDILAIVRSDPMAGFTETSPGFWQANITLGDIQTEATA